MSATLRLLVPLAALGVLACSSSSGNGANDALTASATSIDLSVQSIHDAAGNPLVPTAILGRYGDGCTMHAGGNWVLRLNDATDHSIEIARNDTFANCPLTVIGVQVNVGGVSKVDTLTPAVTLRRTFAPNPSQVTLPDDPEHTLFYANLTLNGLNGDAYTGPFAISMIFSDDARACSLTAPPAVYATVNGVATGSKVAPPSYTLGFDQLQLQVDHDKTVLGSSQGTISLRLTSMGGAQAGEEWRIFDAGNECCESYTFDKIDDLFRSTPLSRAIIEGTGSQIIDWSLLGLQGHVLPAYRTIVVRHSDGGGVPSYELFQILFPGPVG